MERILEIKYPPSTTSTMPIGRPTLLNRDLIEQIPQLVKRYCYLTLIADAIGCDRRTLQRWHKKGAEQNHRVHATSEESPGTPVELTEKEELQLDFCRALRKAHADLVSVLLNRVRTWNPGCWQQAAWELERWRPDYYGRGRGYDAAMEAVIRDAKADLRERMKTATKSRKKG